LGVVENLNEPIRFDTKLAVLLRDDLPTWQRLNVTAFLVSGIAATNPELVGEPYEDADGTEYLPMFRQPVLVFEGSKEFMAVAHGRALGREIPVSVFTSDLLPPATTATTARRLRRVRAISSIWSG
jgi:hypothetical protein